MINIYENTVSTSKFTVQEKPASLLLRQDESDLICKTWSKVIDHILFDHIIDNFSKLYPIVATLTLRYHDHSNIITEHEIQMELRTIPKPEKYTTKFRVEFLPIINSLKKPLVKDLFKERGDINKANKNSDKGKNKTKIKDNFSNDNSSIGVETKILKEVEISEIFMSFLDLAIEFQYVPNQPITFFVKSVGFRSLFVISLFKNSLKN
ncbi:hypothetical protein C2G38_2110465 [Gigaspora rosea]|uniref:Uncharacterized protein n=1 Tax=Gigaspora rosea TaxID=44941 RepID=A0A397UHZ1_9GLOM|nr:hypothetical protein C2G38_2110465 [Gigaspora rosea]